MEPVCYGHLGTIQKCPDYQGVLIFQVSLHHLEPQLGVWIMQVSTFSSVEDLKDSHAACHCHNYRESRDYNNLWGCLYSTLDECMALWGELVSQ